MPKLSPQGLLSVLTYSLYPPTFLFGPLILFSDWCSSRRSFVQESIAVPSDYRGCLTSRVLSYRSLAWRGFRLIIWLLLWEVIIHTVYPGALIYSMTQPIMHVPLPPLPSNASFHGSPFIQTDRSAPGCAVYLLGMQFYFTYLQLYGWPRWFSDLEILLTRGVNSGNSVRCLVPDGPQCFSHMLLFSQLWRYAIHISSYCHRYLQMHPCTQRISRNHSNVLQLLKLAFRVFVADSVVK